MHKHWVKWSQEEYDFLDELEGNFPSSELCRLYRLRAKKKGWPYRSNPAIKSKVWKIYGSTKAMNKNFSVSTFAEILGYKKDRVVRWVKRGLLHREKLSDKITIIRQKEIHRFAKEYPHLLSDADEVGLKFLYGEKKAREILALPSSKTLPKKVYWAKTGTVFKSSGQAARAVHCCPCTIRRWCRSPENKDWYWLESIQNIPG